jgi:hypothetical protein
MIDVEKLTQKAKEFISANPQIMSYSVRNERSLWKLLADYFFRDSTKFTTVIKLVT